ncbi:YtxH domain-containing protein [Segetibacter sp. 3557_3]|uniref:YtxH domain-containing protein n=1 Tax=Segetibacter sp. 3557_3 TaxID=2547429 RepID=UPI0010588DB7|nr:YtxH domain-containing protein [Segetibacter sp. 3557_3]TDH23440.1 YtxH domain-containing protein [Segetibacter sp. 3557_3]
MNSDLTEYSDYNYLDSDSQDSKRELKKVLIGVLAGAALGGLVGAAFTEKGKKTTSRLTRSTKQLAENIKEKAVSSGVADSLARTYEAAKDSVVDAIGKEAQNFTSGGKTNSGSTGNV